MVSNAFSVVSWILVEGPAGFFFDGSPGGTLQDWTDAGAWEPDG